MRRISFSAATLVATLSCSSSAPSSTESTPFVGAKRAIPTTHALMSSAPVRLGARDAFVEVSALDVRDVPGVRDGKTTKFVGAIEDGDVVHVGEARDDHFEELRILKTPRGSYASRYVLQVGRDIATVRAREGYVEAVDATGFVRLSAAPAWARDAKGIRRWADVSVTREAADRYAVTWSWDLGGLAAPITVDPTWSAVASMKEVRRDFGAVLLADGRVFVFGGRNEAGALIPESQAYSPTTNTWTDEGSLQGGGCDDPKPVRASNGKILACYGSVYDPLAKSWSTYTGIGNDPAFAVPGGKIAMVWGSFVELIAESNWLVTDTIPTPTGFPVHSWAVAAIGSKVYAFGGSDASGRVRASSFVFDAAAKTWTRLADLPGKRAGSNALVVGSKIVVLDGVDEAGAMQPPWIFDPSLSTWKVGSAVPLRSLTLVTDVKGRPFALDEGGVLSASYDLARDEWLRTSLRTYTYDRSTGIVRLLDGRIFAAGGRPMLSPTTRTNAVEIFSPVADGVGCDEQSPGDCVSGFCVSGVCCNTACSGACESCTTTANPGKCSPLTGAPRAGQTCGLYSTCEAGVCASACTSSATCGAGAYCLANKCVARKAAGAACTPATAESCASGFCVDGVCCDSACSGTCEACNLLGREGACTAVRGAPVAPRPACTGTGLGTPCGPVCNGITRATCGYLPAGSTPCGANTCAAGVETHLATCNGAGACGDVTKACLAYVCGDNACKSACASNADCNAGHACTMAACVPYAGLGESCIGGEQCSTGFCTDGVCCATSACGSGETCAAPGKAGTCFKQNGIACAAAGQCASGNCVDGVCCSTTCDGQCEACDVAGQTGTCAAVRGAPRGGRTACSAGDAPCAATSCDGTVRTSCARKAGTEVACAKARCEGAKLHPEATCNGSGACVDDTLDCGAYLCDDASKACKVSCSTDVDCATGNLCRDGRCRPVSTTCSADGASTVAPDGTTKSCAPFICKGGECGTACGSTDDCAAGFLCDGNGTCTGAAPVSEDEGGCTASRTGRTGAGSGLALVALVGALFARRRRAAIAAAAPLLLAGCGALSGKDPPPAEHDTVAEGIVRELVARTGAPLAPGRFRRSAFSSVLGSGLRTHGDGSIAQPLVIASPDGPTLTIETEDLGAARASVVGTTHVFAGLHPSIDVAVAVSAEGAEELRIVRAKTERHVARYRVRTELHLSLDGDEVRGVDDQGRRFLVMQSPFAVDARGTRRSATVTLTREADAARIEVSFALADLELPITVDPVWTLASECNVRHKTPLLSLPGGDALFLGDYFTKTEQFSKTTGFWSIVADPPALEFWASSVTLLDGTVLLAGGQVNSTAASKKSFIRSVSGTWSQVGDLPTPRQDAPLVRLGSGKALLVGGHGNVVGTQEATSYLYDPVAKTWSSAGNSYLSSNPPVALVRAGAASALCRHDDGKLQLWTAGIWTDVPAPSVAIQSFVDLADGRVLAVGAGATAQARIFNPNTMTWTDTNGPLVSNGTGILTRLANGRVLLVGAYTTSAAEVFDPSTEKWAPASALKRLRSNPKTALLADGRVMVALGEYAPSGSAFDTELFEQQANSAACTGAGECASGFCVDGVCCNSACTGACEACNLPTSVGTCSNRTGAPISGHPTCGNYAACTNGVCDASCATDASCTPSSYCLANKCVARAINGGACGQGRECASGFCADGVCCDMACDGACEACNETGKPGQCIAVVGAPRASHPACIGTPVGGGCGRACLGENRRGCELPPAGAACSAAACTSGIESHVSSCDGVGSCGDLPKSCGAFACGATACNTSCSSATDCAAGFVCRTGACIPAPGLAQPCSVDTPCAAGLFCADGVCCGVAACPSGQSCATATKKGICATKDGTACSADAECGSGSCVDGVCCESRCAGQCQACDVAGSLGKCVAVKGTPHGSRIACSQGNSVCEATSCDGSDGSRCAALVSAEVTCREGACVDGVATTPATCDGKGACPELVKAACAPYLCAASGKACATACTTDVECTPGNVCTAGQCVKAAQRCSDDGLAVLDADGNRSACAPFRCRDKACVVKCATSDDCIGGTLCSEGTCAAATAPPGTDEGGCAYRGRPAASHAFLFALSLCALGLLRTRRT